MFGGFGSRAFEGRIVDLLFRVVTVRGFALEKWLENHGKNAFEFVKEALVLMSQLILIPFAGKRFSLHGFKDAWKHAELEGRGGKVLLANESIV